MHALSYGALLLLFAAKAALGGGPAVCGTGQFSAALDSQITKVEKALKSHASGAATGVGVWKPQSHAAFAIGARSGAIPPRSLITFLDGAGQERKLLYLGTEVKNGQTFLLYENAAGQQERMLFDKFIEGAQADSIKISGGTAKAKPAAKQPAGFEDTQVAVDPKKAGSAVHPGEPAHVEPGEPATAPAGKDRVKAADGSASVEIKFPEITYTPPKPGQTAQAMAEAELGIPLGNEMAHGGMRRVYSNAAYPGKVIKVYDPSLMAKGAMTPELTAELIQRELGMEDFLVKQGVRVAKIDRSPAAQALWKRGIIIQERADGHGLWGYLGDQTIGDIPKVDQYMAQVYKYDADMQRVIKDRYGVTLSVNHEFGGDPIPVGIDVGSQYSNIHVDADGNPILIDW